jgi:hypothetical protein
VNLNLIINLGFLVGVIVIAVVSWFFIDKRYRGGGVGANLQPTNEVFRDPGSGRLTRVWEDPKSGKREYREEPPGS